MAADPAPYSKFPYPRRLWFELGLGFGGRCWWLEAALAVQKEPMMNDWRLGGVNKGVFLLTREWFCE